MSDFELLSHNGGEPRERNPSASGAPSRAPAEQGNAELAGYSEGHGETAERPAHSHSAEAMTECRTSIDEWSSAARRLNTGPITAAGSTMTTFPFSSLECPNDRIEVRPELSTNLTSVMSSHTSPSVWKPRRAAVSSPAL